MPDSDEAFDASVGLAFSLKAFETYRKSGVLSAEIRSLPGARGKHKAYLELTQGKITTCYLVDQAGKRQGINPQLLIQLDDEKGPFAWTFHANVEQPANMPSHEQVHRAPSQTKALSPVPQPLVRYLDPKQLQIWTPQQQQYIYTVFALVNGQRTINEIKSLVPLPPGIVDEVIRILLALRAIVLQ